MALWMFGSHPNMALPKRRSPRLDRTILVSSSPAFRPLNPISEPAVCSPFWTRPSSQIFFTIRLLLELPPKVGIIHSIVSIFPLSRDRKRFPEHLLTFFLLIAIYPFAAVFESLDPRFFVLLIFFRVTGVRFPARPSILSHRPPRLVSPPAPPSFAASQVPPRFLPFRRFCSLVYSPPFPLLTCRPLPFGELFPLPNLLQFFAKKTPQRFCVPGTPELFAFFLFFDLFFFPFFFRNRVIETLRFSPFYALPDRLHPPIRPCLGLLPFRSPFFHDRCQF